MPRSARIVVPNYPYHITQRGNYRQKIFEDQEDRSIYLTWMNEYSKRYDLTLLAYCLMDNHVHFIVIPGEERSLSKVFSIVHMRYSQYYNKKRGTAGHLWQGRFYSCLLDEMHLMAAMRYVEKNPVRARLVKKAWNWKWSSARLHTGRSKEIIGLGDIKEIVDLGVEGWEEYLEGDEIKEELEKIRKNTMLGRPMGSSRFIEELEKKVGSIIRRLPRGRPRKKIKY
jgi:putative transposase